MIKPVTMYSVVCDRCGKTFIEEFNGIVAWLDEGTAKEQAMESEWAEIGDKHYCPDCYEYDDELDETEDREIVKDCLKGWLELNCGQEADLCGYPDWKSAEVE